MNIRKTAALNNDSAISPDVLLPYEQLIKPRSTIAVAVSGGADSMALLLLLHEWQKKNAIKSGVKLHALTVDHALRPESAAESQQIAQHCALLGIEHTILLWKHDRISSGIPEKARNARYKLMSEFCACSGISLLFTAHHLDDQIETIMLRLLRGSSIIGMSGIMPVSTRGAITLVRPLLAIEKNQLYSFLKSKNHSWIEDPSNNNLLYSRNYLRAHLQTLSYAQKKRLAAIVEYFQNFRKLLENRLETALEESLCNNNLDHEKFINQPEELKKLILQHICKTMGKSDEPPRSEKIIRLLDVIEGKATENKYKEKQYTTNKSSENKYSENKYSENKSTVKNYSSERKYMLHGVLFRYIKKDKLWKISNPATQNL